MKEAHHVDDFESLLDCAETFNRELVEPMLEAEVAKIATSAWGYTERGENRFGRHGVWFPTDEANGLIAASPNDFLLLSYLRAKDKPEAAFWVANGLAEKFGWSRQRLAETRLSLISRGYLKLLREETNTRALPSTA